MKPRRIIAGSMIALIPFLASCGDKSGGATSGGKETPAEQPEVHSKVDVINQKKLDSLNNVFRSVPDGRLLENGETPLYAELKKRYAAYLDTFSKEVAASGAKLVVSIITDEAGSGLLNPNKFGDPYSVSLCREKGIECIDFTSVIAKQSPYEITQIPRDGHWSEKGAKFMADQLQPVIKKYYTVTSTVTYKDSERPETFGDLAPNLSEIRDGGKDMPYHVQSNAQGMRMDHDVKFPKKKKHVVLIGDSAFFCPFLDNELTISGLLQQRMDDAEIMNVAQIGYTIDDYLTLWREKVKYAEPDIVILQTAGEDIMDMYFTERNQQSRSHKPYYPSSLEYKFYQETYLR